MANAKIMLTRNRPYKLTIIIKEPGGPTALATSPSDQVYMHFKEKKHNGKLILSKQLTPLAIACPEGETAPCYGDGQWVMRLDPCETKLFIIKEGFNEDGRPYLSGYRAQLSIDFHDNDLEFADVQIEEIYVSDIGLPDCEEYNGGDS